MGLVRKREKHIRKGIRHVSCYTSFLVDHLYYSYVPFPVFTLPIGFPALFAFSLFHNLNLTDLNLLAVTSHVFYWHYTSDEFVFNRSYCLPAGEFHHDGRLWRLLLRDP